MASGHRDFCVGADITGVYAERDAARLQQRLRKLNGLYRQLETLGVPVVAALTGSALGGGFELVLACHHRVALDDARIQIGLPEVSLGLLPGAGGTQRLPRLIGLQAALQHIAEGIIKRPRDAEVGAVFDLGFAPNKGGPLSYIARRGVSQFVSDCDAFAEQHGDRYAAAQLLRDMATQGERFFEPV